jgi:hypothetical protein
VIDSREAADAIRRRRRCEACEERFTTYERAQAVRMHVVKRNGRREPFDRDKLLRGLQRAAAKRPIDPDRLDELVDSIQAAVRRRGGEDLSAFEAELRRLESEPVAGPDQLEIEVLQDEAVPSAQESILATPSGGLSKPRRTPRNNQSQRRGHASHP